MTARLAALACLGLTAAAAGGVWLDVPFLRQEKNACGAASITMLGRYWRAQGARAIPEFEPSRIHAQLYAPEKRGVPGEAMERFLREAGFRVFVLRGEWADLEEHLSKGRPLLVCLGPSGETRLHYAWAAGVDTAQGAVWLNDPARRKLTRLSRREFERAWSRSGNWTLLAVPADEP
jgi:ABC-type bacteriocin/lantibiotic exporter with double-glycine peptidase domain